MSEVNLVWLGQKSKIFIKKIDSKLDKLEYTSSRISALSKKNNV